MPLRRLLVQLVALGVAVAILGAQPPVAPTVGLVRQLYADVSCEAVLDEPRCPADRDLSLMSRAQLARYFDTRLLNLWLRDRECAALRHEICNLDFAPLWDSQDPAGTTVRVRAGDRANRVVVELRRPASTEVVRLHFDLVKSAAGWRIRDVSKPAVWSLVELLSRKFADEWMADSLSDRVYLSLSNGLYGSGWTFDVPEGRLRTDIIYGRSKEFSDDNPPVKYPTRNVIGRRVECGESLKLAPSPNAR